MFTYTDILGLQGHINIERFTNNNIIIMGAYPKQDQWYYLTLVCDGNNLISDFKMGSKLKEEL